MKRCQISNSTVLCNSTRQHTIPTRPNKSIHKSQQNLYTSAINMEREISQMLLKPTCPQILSHTETLLFRLITPPHLGQICSLLTTTRQSPSPGFSCAGAPATDSCGWFLRASCWSRDGIARLSICWRLMRRTEASTLAADVLPRWSSITWRRARCSLASSDAEADRHRLSTRVPWK